MRQSACLALVLVVVTAAAWVARSDLLAPVERLLVDRLQWVVAERPDPRIVVVGIDDRSIEAVGRWPWSRRMHATLVRKLHEAGAAVIGFDILFTEPDLTDPEGDEALVEAMHDAGNVVLAMFARPAHSGGAPPVGLPLEDFVTAAIGVGHAHVSPDSDGKVRRLAGDGQQQGWPALASAMAAVGAGTAAPAPGLSLAASDRPLVPMPPAMDGLRLVSAADVLNGAVGKAELKDTLVLVGLTGSGLAPLLPVAMPTHTSMMPGVFFQAIALDAVLHGNLVRPLAWRATSAGLITLAALVPGLIFGWRLRVLVLNIAIPLGIGIVFLVGMRLLAPMGVPILAATITTAGMMAGTWAHRWLALVREQARAAAALGAIEEGVIAAGPDRRIDYANLAARRILAASGAGDDLLGRDLAGVLARFTPPLTLPDVPDGETGTSLVSWAPPVPVNTSLGRDEGARLILRARLSAIKAPHHRGHVLAFSDITTEQRLAEELALHSTHDPLTRLPNRYLLADRLARAIDRCVASGGRLAVVAIELHRLDALVEALGQQGGDNFICEVAARLQGVAASRDTLSRIAGERFIVVIEGIGDETEALAACAGYQRALNRPLEIAGHEIHSQASIGVALYPRDGADVEMLLRCAGAAARRAREDGRSQVLVYREGLPHTGTQMLIFDHELREAVRSGAFELHYQPRFLIADRGLSGAECLVRWRHPEQGMISPGHFIPLAEETGLIVELGRFVIENACRELSVSRALRRLRSFSVNLSVIQLKRDASLIGFIAETLKRYAIEPRMLELEITESLFLDPALPALGRRLGELEALGITLSIDDFGTGYSSLAYLSRFPFSRIKIDRAFVARLEQDRDSRAIVNAIVGLGTALGKSTTAEGVENETQLAHLAELGCNEAQGFLLGRPRALADWSELH